MPYTIRTTINPSEEITVSDREYADLLAQGLVFGAATPAPADPDDIEVQALVENETSLTYGALSAAFGRDELLAKHRLRTVAVERATLGLTAAETPTIAYYLGNTTLLTSPITYDYTTAKVRHSGGYPQERTASGTTYYENGLIGGGPKMPWRHSFIHQGTNVEFQFQATATSSFRIFIDGLPLSSGLAVPTGLTAGSRYRMRLTFANRRTRRITVEAHNAPFGGIHIPSGDLLSAAEMTSAVRALWCGLDSWGAGTGATDNLNAFSVRSRQRLGFDNLAIDAQGGTGYLNPGSAGVSAQNFVDRLTTALARFPAPDVVMLGPSGRNDAPSNGYTLAALGAAVTAACALVASEAPDALLIVGGLNQNTDAPATEFVDTAAAIKAAALAAPNLTAFIDPSTGDVLGPGGTAIRTGDGPWITAASAANLIHPSGGSVGHPTDAGHDAYSMLWANAVNSVLLPI